MQLIGNILEALKLPAKLMLGVFVASGLVLLLGSRVPTLPGLRSFVDSYGEYVTLTFICSGALVLIHLGGLLWTGVRAARGRATRSRALREKIDALDSAEQAVLREFFGQGQNTLIMPVDHPTVAGLVQSGVLRLVGSIGRPGLRGVLYPVEMSSEARQLVLENSGRIGLPMRRLTQDEVSRLKKDRPAFMTDIQNLNW